VFLSSAGLLARTANDERPGRGGARAKHDVMVSSAEATARGTIGVVTTSGRLLKLDVLDLPVVPTTAAAPQLQGGAPLTEFLPLDPGERPVALTSLRAESLGLALGTKAGIVKRVQPEILSNRESWDVIRLDDGDEVVGGVELAHADDELVFIASDAQLLHFPASTVRPQGRSGGGIAGIRLSAGARVVYFGAVAAAAENLVVTVSGSSDALPGTEAGLVKVTPLTEYPGKGRGTGGVRCHRFLKGEDTLIVAAVVEAPAKAAAASGAPIDLPEEHARRDGSGVPAAQPIAAIAGQLRE
jgi:DNA gyrase subunit A